uniref:Fanconi anemia core complex-associated protein 24 pseudonuclease domain-containing protein n=1 Tax=Capitella teleta TaxID=283909 RepID=X2A7L9_CAPTE
MAVSSIHSVLPQPAVNVFLRVPNGHIVCSEKWRSTELIRKLACGVNVLYDDNIGILDFCPSENIGVIYVSEGDLLAGAAYKRKLAKLRMANKVKGVVIVERTSVTEQYFSKLQQLTVLELGMVLLPVGNQAEAANILIGMVHVENKPHDNQLRLKVKNVSIETSVLNTVKTIPCLGDVNARALLECFGSILKIALASEQDLAVVIGRAKAAQVRSFFSQNGKL